MWLDILWETFFARLLPLFKEVTLSALRQFQPEQYVPYAALATVAALAAYAVLYAMGVWLRRMPDRVSTEEQKARIKTMEPSARYWLPWLLILAASPVGPALLLAAGFFRLKPWLTFVCVLAAELLWRLSPALNN